MITVIHYPLSIPGPIMFRLNSYFETQNVAYSNRSNQTANSVDFDSVLCRDEFMTKECYTKTEKLHQQTNTPVSSQHIMSAMSKHVRDVAESTATTLQVQTPYTHSTSTY